MDRDSGIRRKLSMPWIYEQSQNPTGAIQARRSMAENCWRFKSGDAVIDMGEGFSSRPRLRMAPGPRSC